ncbi:hypothetical protein [uncultured Microbacterium sp.]|uniref:hypothetical protein n=1 Tax=uncultured Microbacterium sp. TaxID=191216 RepID=UPI0025ED26AE|nr:hypothetical protein [uncultured Microbacterium sp.]
MTAAPSRTTLRRRPNGWLVAVVVVVAVILAPVIGGIAISAQNDAAADAVKNQLVSMPLPPDTQLVDSYSRAGKLVGNGNGMQYLGAMLIQSHLPIAELESYYAQQADTLDESRTSEYPTTINVRQGDSSQLQDIRGLSGLLTQSDQSDRFLVYMWGDAPSWLHEDWDLRGH